MGRGDVAGAGAGPQTGDLAMAGREVFVARIPVLGDQIVEKRRQPVDRVVQVFRKSRVSLYAVNLQADVNGTPAADPHGVTELLLAGGFTHQAVIGPSTAALQFISDPDHAIDGFALFIAGQQQTDLASMVRVFCKT